MKLLKSKNSFIAFRKLFLKPPGSQIEKQLFRTVTSRLRILLPVFILVHVVHVLLFLYSIEGTDSETVLLWRHGIILSHAVISVYAVAVLVLLLSDPGEKLQRMIIEITVIFYLLFIISLTVFDQLVTPSINPYIAGIIGISLVFYLRPLQAIIEFLLTYVLFWVAVSLTRTSAEILLSIRVNALTLTAFGIGLSIFLYLNKVKTLRQFRVIELQHERLRRQNRQLQQNRRHRDRLYSIIAHDLRGPIGTANSYMQEMSETIRKKLGSEGTHLERVNSLIGNSYSLLENLLARTGRKQKNEGNCTGWQSVIHESIALYAAMADIRNITFVAGLDAKTGPAAGCYALALITRNLLQNAMNVSPDNSRIDIQAYTDRGSFCLKICDRGPGLPENATENFAAHGSFFEAHSENSKTGLGLSVVHEQLSELKGELGATANDGGGSCLILTLDCA